MTQPTNDVVDRSEHAQDQSLAADTTSHSLLIHQQDQDQALQHIAGPSTRTEITGEEGPGQEGARQQFIAAITKPLDEGNLPSIATPAPQSRKKKTVDATTLRQSRRVANGGNARPRTPTCSNRPDA